MTTEKSVESMQKLNGFVRDGMNTTDFKAYAALLYAYMCDLREECWLADSAAERKLIEQHREMQA